MASTFIGGMMKKPELDLSRKKCHACGAILWKDLFKGTEQCIHYACLIKNVRFTIPVLEDE